MDVDYSTNGVTSNKTNLQLHSENLCFVCNADLGENSEDSVEIFSDKTTSIGTPISFILSQLFNRQLSEETSHSQFICIKCFNSCTEYEEVEQRLIELRLEIIRNFNKTSIKHNLIPVEIEDDEVETNLEIENNEISENDEFVHDIVEDTINDIEEEEHNTNITSGDIVDLNNKNIIVVDKLPILKVYSNKQLENTLESHENSIEDNMTIEYEGSVDNFNPEIGEEYFNEEHGNMVEVITETDSEQYQQLTNGLKIMDDSKTYEDSSQEHKSSLANISFDSSNSEDLSEHIENNKKSQKQQKSRMIKLNDKKSEQFISNEEIFIQKDNSFTCKLCTETPTVNYDCRTIGIHLKSVHNIKIYFCDICGKDFRKRNEFTEHVDEHVEGTENGNFTCELCKRVFNNIRLFRIHKKIHNNAKLWECGICNKNYISKSVLDVHINMHSGLRPYKCSNCDKSFASKYTLAAHMKIHSNRPRPFECKTCNKTFYSGQHLYQHQKTHSGVKPFVCDICEKTFSTQHNLEVHKIVHTGYKPFECKTCGKAFARRAEIKDHERIHTGEKPFKCDICSVSFAQRSNLQSHKRATHFDDKRYKCDICDRRFKRKRLLDYHKNATHTGDRPYKCELCASTFVYPEHYKKHMRIHSGVKPYACEICNKTFNSRDNRNAHRFIHSDKKLYECTVCGRGFMRKSFLFVHMKQASHINDKIIINQAKITSDTGELVMEESETDSDVIAYKEVKLKTERTYVDCDAQNENDIFTIFELNDYEYLEEHIKEEEITEENLIVDGLVQYGGEQNSTNDLPSSEEILYNEPINESIENDEDFVCEDEQIFDGTKNNSVQFVKIDFSKNDSTSKESWIKIES